MARAIDAGCAPALTCSDRVRCLLTAGPCSNCVASAADAGCAPARAVELLRAPELICRAWDENMNTQPDTLTWNLMCALLLVLCILRNGLTYVADCSQFNEAVQGLGWVLRSQAALPGRPCCSLACAVAGEGS